MGQRLANEIAAVLILQEALRVKRLDNQARFVLPLARLRVIGAWAGLIMPRRHLHAQSFMWTHLVIFGAEGRQLLHALGLSLRAPPSVNPMLQTAMHPLHFALRLRVANA